MQSSQPSGPSSTLPLPPAAAASLALACATSAAEGPPHIRTGMDQRAGGTHLY